MLAALPLISWLGITAAFYFRLEKADSLLNCRRAFLSASVVWGVLLTLFTEVLSIGYRLKPAALIGAWGGTAIITLLMALNLARKRWHTTHSCNIRYSHFDLVSSVAVASIVIATGLIAFVAPPNGYDSMTYHMARVAHWAQNGSIGFYPTHILRQLYMNPWAEFAIMHFQILAGADRFANIVSWFSMLGGIIGVSLIARELGGIKTQVFAAVFSATIPMGILQTSGTQNDYVVTFWLISFVYYTMLLRRRVTWTYSLAAGCSLGLAMLTKPTAYIYASPFLVWSVVYLTRRSVLTSLCVVSAIGMCAILINLGHYARMAQLYGSPFRPDVADAAGEVKYTNDTYGFAVLVSNATRNLALHLGTPSEKVNAAEEQSLQLLHEHLGIGINDPRTTWQGTEFHITKPLTHEDAVGNPLHLLLALMCGVRLLASRQLRASPTLTAYALCLLSAAVLFCFVLKWQPWHARLHLGLFVLGAPFVAVVLQELGWRKGIKTATVVLVLAAFPSVLENKGRPLIKRRSIFVTSRTEQYFANKRYAKEAYMGAANFLAQSKCSQVGVIPGVDDWEYPLWVLLQGSEMGAVRMEHVLVKNVSATKSTDDFKPCALVLIGHDECTEIIFKNEAYRKRWSLEHISIFTGRQNTSYMYNLRERDNTIRVSISGELNGRSLLWHTYAQSAMICSPDAQLQLKAVLGRNWS